MACLGAWVVYGSSLGIASFVRRDIYDITVTKDASRVLLH